MCKSSLIKQQYVDCVYWSVDTDKCETNCSLNILNNPKPQNCASCSKRKSHGVKEISESKEISTPETKEKSIVEKVTDYAKAETSQMLQGKVSEEVYEKRKSICMSCEFRVSEAKGITDEIGWCKGGCGCVIGNPRAALSQKLYMPSLKCPKKKFTPEHGIGFNLIDGLDSVKGIVTSIKNNLSKEI